MNLLIQLTYTLCIPEILQELNVKGLVPHHDSESSHTVNLYTLTALQKFFQKYTVIITKIYFSKTCKNQTLVRITRNLFQKARHGSLNEGSRFACKVLLLER